MSLYGEVKPYHEINCFLETYTDKNVRLNNFMGLSLSKLGQMTFGPTKGSLVVSQLVTIVFCIKRDESLLGLCKEQKGVYAIINIEQL